MTFLIDGQIFQTGALERGMGTLTIELLYGLKRVDPSVEIKILLNPSLPVTAAHKERMNELLNDFETVDLEMVTPATGTQSFATRQVEDHITSTDYGKDVTYLIPALFLFDYYAVVPRNCRTTLIFHDLIPLVMWEHLKNVFPREVYFARFPLINQVNTILANSQNTKNEMVDLLGINQDKIVVMGGAPESITLTKTEAIAEVSALGIDEEYVLLPTGGGYMAHKNNTRAIEAIHLLLRDTSHTFKVVATSRYEQHEKEALKKYLGDNIIFTGNVSNRQMHALLIGASTLVIPSLAEGLGIPLLNAVHLGIPVACSRIPVFTELAEGTDPFYEFDPYDIWDMRDKILAAMARVGFDDRRQAYKTIKQKYTWDHCAKHLLTAAAYEPSKADVKKQLRIITPDPYTDLRLGYKAQSLLSHAPEAGYRPVFYIDEGVKKASYADRGADYVKDIAPSYPVVELPRAKEPTIVFLTPQADFTNLHVISRIVEDAVVYIEDDISGHLYPGLHKQHLIDDVSAERERQVQKQLCERGLFSVPHPLLKAKAVIVEERTAASVKQLLKEMDLNIPIKILGDRHTTSLSDYVHESEPFGKQLMTIIAEVYA